MAAKQRAGEHQDRITGVAQEELQWISGVGGRVGWGHGLYPVGHPGSQAAHKRGVLGAPFPLVPDDTSLLDRLALGPRVCLYLAGPRHPVLPTQPCTIPSEKGTSLPQSGLLQRCWGGGWGTQPAEGSRSLVPMAGPPGAPFSSCVGPEGATEDPCGALSVLAGRYLFPPPRKQPLQPLPQGAAAGPPPGRW